MLTLGNPEIIRLVPEFFLLFSRPLVMDRQSRMGAGERFPLPFYRSSNVVVYKAPTENLASTDVPELFFSFSKPVVEIPVRCLNPFIQQTDFLQCGTPDHHTGAVEAVEHDVREAPVDLTTKPLPIPVHRPDFCLQLGGRFARGQPTLPDRRPSALDPVCKIGRRHHLQTHWRDRIQVETFHRVDQPAVPVRPEIQIIVDMTHICSRRIACPKVHRLRIAKIAGVSNDSTTV